MNITMGYAMAYGCWNRRTGGIPGETYFHYWDWMQDHPQNAALAQW